MWREALKFGRQAYLQRRISSEASIGKLLFSNGFKMLESRRLTEAGGDRARRQRAQGAPRNCATYCGVWT